MISLEPTALRALNAVYAPRAPPNRASYQPVVIRAGATTLSMFARGDQGRQYAS